MKRKLIPALLLASVLLMQSIPASAAYTRDTVALSIRPVEGAAIAEDGCIHITTEEAAAGKTMKLGVYIETAEAKLNRLGVRLKTNSDSLTFVPEGTVTAKTEVSETDVYYQLPDGTSFSTTFQPYCLGRVNTVRDKTFYLPNCLSFLSNQTAPNDLYASWLFGIGNATEFLGGQSDLYSFFTFEAALAPGIAAGQYTIEFVTDETSQNPEADHVTALASDEGPITDSDYQFAVPACKALRIIVEGSIKGDVNHDGYVNAKDGTAVLQYAARSGTGGGDISDAERQEMLRLGDVNENDVVNAEDATAILRYAAALGTGTQITWAELIE